MPVAIATATAVPKFINGAKDLKMCIQDMTRDAESIRAEFDHDLQQPKAVVNYPDNDFISIGQGNHEFNARMCQVAHSDFVYNNTQLSQSSQVLQCESVVKDCLARLEELRKMLVNNKQQKKTTINAIRRIIIADINSSRNSAQVFEEIDYQSPIVVMLRGLIEQTKQNHKTINRNILDQVRAIVLDMRTRHIRMFEQSAQQTVEAIIQHADKCRVFMAQCRHLAIVEYCANLWWTKTQKEHYHQKKYYVSALLAEDKGELKRFHAAIAGLSAARPMNVEILVFEHNEMQSEEKEQCILTYDLDEELAAEILTDEAIQTFEDDERDAKQVWSSSSSSHQHQHQHQSQQDADADDDHQVWNYWSHPHDYNDYAAQAMS
jgi:hypothetical protein